MANFRYQALSADQQPIAGELEADSVSQAIVLLEEQGLSVLSIGYATSQAAAEGMPRPAVARSRATPVEAAPAGDDVQLQQQMSRVLERAAPLVPALRAYASELPRGRNRRQLQRVLDIIERGNVREATVELPPLSAYWIPLLGAAESSREPGHALREMLEEAQRAEDLRRQWWRALAYPAVIAGLAAVVMTALSLIVIPIYRDILLGFDVPLPWLTLLVVRTSESIVSGRIVLVILAIVAIGFVLSQARVLLPKVLRAELDDYFGTPFGRTTALARFCQFAADLLQAEFDPREAVRLAGQAANSSRLRRAAWRLSRDLELGEPVQRAAYRPILTSTVLHSLTAAMPLAARIRLLREISSSYAERSRARVSWTRGMVEPLAIGVIGVVIGVTVIGLFLPLVSLVQGLS